MRLSGMVLLAASLVLFLVPSGNAVAASGVDFGTDFPMVSDCDDDECPDDEDEDNSEDEGEDEGEGEEENEESE